MILTFKEFILEQKKNPCWKGYKQIGTKKKRGKIVPNCVKEQKESHLKMYEDSSASAQAPLTQEQIDFLNQYTEGTWQLNPQTGLVDVDGDFNCKEQSLADFKGVRFGVVRGGFYCHDNLLTSLEGAPQKVGGGFSCDDNQLTSLVGAPQKVGGDFSCSNNHLTSLEGAPQEVGGYFSCHANQLTSLEGAPQNFGGDFYCRDNLLTSLEGAPRKVGGGFYCYDNLLTSLVGAPQKVGGDFSCSNNQLTSLVGAPQKVGGDFYCSNNQLTSLEGAPQEVGGDFYCGGNPISEKTLKMIFDLMQKGYDYAVALGMLKSKISKTSWNKLQKPEGYDYDALKNASDFGIL